MHAPEKKLMRVHACSMSRTGNLTWFSLSSTLKRVGAFGLLSAAVAGGWRTAWT